MAKRISLETTQSMIGAASSMLHRRESQQRPKLTAAAADWFRLILELNIYDEKSEEEAVECLLGEVERLGRAIAGDIIRKRPKSNQ